MTRCKARGIVLVVIRVWIALALALAAVTASAQNSTESAKIRVGTHLVQIGVIVRDSSGPVKNLTKDDFVLLDRGKPREIGVFSSESTDSAPEFVEALAQNTFSDLPRYGESVPTSVTIVLLDNLNTLSGNGHEGYESGPVWMEDLALANAKAHLVEFIKNLDPKERVAIYGLSESLHVLCDFTGDRERLLAVLREYDTASRTNREAAEPGGYHTPVPGKEFNANMDAQALEFAAATNERRTMQTTVALRSIASHVATIPGRKNLVWLTANLPFSGAALARILVPAQIAAYPVDARGLLPRATPTSAEDVAAYGSQLTNVLGLDESPAQSDQPIGVDAMEKIAEVTGGRAFVNTNDVTGAIRKAVEDSAITYTLGFYINSNSLDGKFHELKVQVHRSGLNLRYPRGYFALKETAATQDERHASFLAAIRSPLDSSAIPLQIKVDRVDQPAPNSLSLFGAIGIQDLRLARDGDTRVGAVDVTVIEQDETGKVLRESANRINLRFSEKQYPVALKTGITFRKAVQPQAGATTLRVLVQDPTTASIGSLIIPLSQLK